MEYLTNNQFLFLKKKEARCQRNNKFLRLHLNARDFSQHKIKMSAGRVRVVCVISQTGHREKWLQTRWIMKVQLAER